MSRSLSRPSRDAWFFRLFFLWVFVRQMLRDDSLIWRVPAAIAAAITIWELIALVRRELRWRGMPEPEGSPSDVVE